MTTVLRVLQPCLLWKKLWNFSVLKIRYAYHFSPKNPDPWQLPYPSDEISAGNAGFQRWLSGISVDAKKEFPTATIFYDIFKVDNNAPDKGT
jgi:hypothetical protein